MKCFPATAERGPDSDALVPNSDVLRLLSDCSDTELNMEPNPRNCIVSETRSLMNVPYSGARRLQQRPTRLSQGNARDLNEQFLFPKLPSELRSRELLWIDTDRHEFRVVPCSYQLAIFEIERRRRFSHFAPYNLSPFFSARTNAHFEDET